MHYPFTMLTNCLPLRFVSLGFAFLTGALVASAQSQLITNLNAGQNQKLVVYGTSLTASGAWASTTAGSGGIYDWLKAQYGSKFTMVNSGMGGKASNTGVLQLYSKVISHNPDTVMIEFTMNDSREGVVPPGDPDYGITIAKSKENLNTMIDQILAANPNAEVILQTMNPAWDVPPSGQSGSARPNFDAYCEVYREVAVDRDLLLIDHFENWDFLAATDFTRFTQFVPDGLHPTATASLQITMPAVKRALLGQAATPPAPSGVVRTECNAKVALFWPKVVGAINYTVRRSTTTGGPYATIASDLTITTYQDTSVTNGTTYYYVVNAENGFGLSPNSAQLTATPATNGVVIVDDSNPFLTYTPGTPGWVWSADPEYFNGTKAVCSTADKSVFLTYTGTTISVYVKRLPSGGIFDLYINGAFVATLDTYSPTVQHNVGIYSSVRPYGTHTVELRVKHQKSASSTGYAIGFDHFNYRP